MTCEYNSQVMFVKDGDEMALSSIKIHISNNPYRGCIEIVSEKQQGASSNIAYVLIHRKRHGSSDSYQKIYEKVINTVNDLTFEDIDITSKFGISYDYFIELTNGNTTGYTVYEFDTIYNIECWFEGLFVGTYDKQYMAHLNCNTSTVQNTQANYVMTIASRTPYRISNAYTNYTTGQSSGLFAPLDSNGQPILQDNKEYIEEVVRFLCDGENKFLKTNDGQIWYVSIDPSVDISSDENFRGSSEISFNWTEIDDVPTIKKVTS